MISGACSWVASSLMSLAQLLCEYSSISSGASCFFVRIDVFVVLGVIIARTVRPYPRQSGATTRRPMEINMGIW